MFVCGTLALWSSWKFSHFPPTALLLRPSAPSPLSNASLIIPLFISLTLSTICLLLDERKLENRTHYQSSLDANNYASIHLQNNLLYGAYGNADEFAEDVRLVWSNCEKYNGPDHYITGAANGLRKAFDKTFMQLKTKEFEPLPDGYVPPPSKGKPTKKVARLDGTPTHSRPEMTYDEKRALCTNINSLDPKYLGRVIQIINRCLPNILDERAPGQEEIEISVESLSNNALRELEDYVKELKLQKII